MFPINKSRKHCCNLKLDVPLLLNFSGDVVTNEKMDSVLINVKFELIKTAIKFFLFQRCQIPIPYEKIQRRERLKPLTDERHVNNIENVSSPVEEMMLPEDLSPKERIKLMKLKQKEFQKQKQHLIKCSKILKTEENILRVWDTAFETLQKVFLMTTSSTNLTNTPKSEDIVILTFGPSILNPKEVIVFEFMDNQRINESFYEKIFTSEDMITITRSFYKTLIMSTVFTEFTEKTLRSTYSQICLVTKEPKTDEMIEKECLTRVENINFLKEINSPEQNIRKKTLHIKLNFQNNFNLVLKKDNNHNNNHSILNEDISEIFCYQLPLKGLRFKGVSVL